MLVDILRPVSKSSSSYLKNRIELSLKIYGGRASTSDAGRPPSVFYHLRLPRLPHHQEYLLQLPRPSLPQETNLREIHLEILYLCSSPPPPHIR
ncbi:hypothetical protein Bca4012_089804 [Brassica carinata]